MNKNTKKVIVAGATGFIGRNVVELLIKNPNFSVTGIWNNRPPYKINNLDWIKADLSNKQDIEKHLPGYDILIQMASVTSGSKDVFESPHIHITDNALMNSLLMRAAYDFNYEHFVLPSCSIIYNSSDKPHDEYSFNPSIEIQEKYFGGAWNKIYFENICRFYSNIGNTKFSIIRHSNVYGPYDKFDLEKSHVFGATITKIMKNKSDSIEIWGDGTEGRDLIYVDDLTSLIELMILKQKKPYEIICAGSGYTLPINELVKKIMEVSGKSFKIKHNLDKPSIKSNISLTSKIAKDEYNWSPKVDIDEGIRKTLDWYRKHY